MPKLCTSPPTSHPQKHTHKEIIKSLSFNSFQGRVSFSFQGNKTKGNCNIGGMELKDSENFAWQYAFRGLNFTDLSITNFLCRKSVKVYGQLDSFKTDMITLDVFFLSINFWWPSLVKSEVALEYSKSFPTFFLLNPVVYFASIRLKYNIAHITSLYGMRV